MSDVLARILAHKADEVASLRARYSRAALADLAAAAGPARGFVDALREAVSGGRPGVIAEIKKASPSKGIIRADFDPAFIAREYAANGAACLSVLTDERFFQGHLQHLQAARLACALPLLRKDFTIDPLQLHEARAHGADAVLLIAAALAPSLLAELHGEARQLGLDVLVEVHDAAELEQVLKANLPGEWLLGINNRSLRTFETRLETTLELLPRVPAALELVTESGIGSRADIQRLRSAGVHRFLVGESLMREPSPGAALRALLG